jgi:hypothetical protein
MNYQPIFKSEEHQKLFESQGFVTIPMLDEIALKELNLLFDELHPTLAIDGFISGGYSSDIDYKKKSSKFITEIMESFVDKVLTDYKIYGSTFVYKIPSKNSELGPHQDWTIIDESKYFSLNCWVPLCDVSVKNGTMYVLPGSHYIKHKSIRAPSLGYYYDNYRDVVLKYMIPMKVKAGTAVIINHSIIHYSSPNLSSNIRKAIITAAKSKEAQTFLYYWNKDIHKLEKYIVKEDFALDYNDFFYDNKLKPNGLFWESETFSEVKYKKKEIENLFTSMLRDSKYYNSDFEILLNKVRNKLTII